MSVDSHIMESETFPDVTLADQMILEQRGLKANDGLEDGLHDGLGARAGGGGGAKNTVVLLHPGNSRIHFTKCQIVGSFFVIFLILTVAILASVLVTKSVVSQNECADCEPAQSSISADSSSSSSSSTPREPGSACKETGAVSEAGLGLNSSAGCKSEVGDSKSGVHLEKASKSDSKLSDVKHTSYTEDASGDKGEKISITKYPWSNIRLPRSAIPERYDLLLKIDLTKFVFVGAVNISVRINTSTNYVVFHRKDITIDTSSISIRSLYSPSRRIVRQFTVPDKQFHVIETGQPLVQGNTYVISIGRYFGELRDRMRGLYVSSYTTKDGRRRYLMASQLQAMDARRVFPCLDEPDRKAKFNVSIVHEPGYTALANMPSVTRRVLQDGWIKQDFATTPFMSTYLLAFVVADFKARNETLDNGYEIRIWARREAYEQTEHALAFSVKAYKYFTEYFGIHDVVPKADHVAVPDFPSGAMENWGLVIYRETSLLYDAHVSSTRDKFMVTLIMAHEIAHTWFGNMVTMKWWDDLWLNEGFASLLMYAGMDHVYPEWKVFDIQVVSDILPVMVKDGLTTSHPVSTQILDPEEIHQHFDDISYSKGMAVMRMLMGFAGRDVFRDGLRMYVQRYKFTNADMAQLWSTFSESFNYTYDVAKIMDTWTRQMGYPVVTVTSNATHHILSQSRFLLDHTMGEGEPGTEDSLFGYKWYIPFTYVSQNSRKNVQLTWLNLENATIPRHDTGWLLGNYEYTGYFRVMYEKEMWQQFALQLDTDHTVIPEANRAGLIGDAFALARANLLDYNIALSLTSYLHKERSYTPWRAFMDAIEFLKGMIANKAAYIQLQQYLRDQVAPVYDKVKTNQMRDSLPGRYLGNVILSTACDVGVDTATEYANSMFVNWMNHHSSLPSDLALLSLSVGIREGGAAEWDFVWNKTRLTSVATEKNMMMESLAKTQKPWLLWRYIDWLFDQRKIRQQDVRLVISHFTKTPLARMVALEFLMSRWDHFVDTFGDVTFLLRDVIQDVTKYVNTEFHLEMLENLFEKKTPKSATKAVGNAVALIKANIGWMDANYKKITDWLDKSKARRRRL